MLAMPRVETRGPKMKRKIDKDVKPRSVTCEFIVWIISTFQPPLQSHRQSL